MYRSSRSRVRYALSGLGTTLDDLAAAIARFEGACTAPGVCRNNNPGNLRAGNGATGVDSRGIAIFPDFATGEAALLRQEQLNIDRGLSLSEFFGGKTGVYKGYAPAADSNNPVGYTATVAGWLGIDPSLPLSSVIGGESPAPVIDASPEFDSAVVDFSPWILAALALAGVAIVAELS